MINAWYKILEDDTIDVSTSFKEGYVEYDMNNEPDEVKSRIYDTDEAKIYKAKKYLNDTQFKFGDDYDLKDTPEWIELKQKRQEAREFIRANK